MTHESVVQKVGVKFYMCKHLWYLRSVFVQIDTIRSGRKYIINITNVRKHYKRQFLSMKTIFIYFIMLHYLPQPFVFRLVILSPKNFRVQINLVNPDLCHIITPIFCYIIFISMPPFCLQRERNINENDRL